MATPSPEELEGLLRPLATRGLLLWSVIDDHRDLLALECVRAELKDDGGAPSPERLFDALAAYLEKALARVQKFQHRRLLAIVLAVDEQYRGTTAKARRTAAGEKFRGENAPAVTAGNIRQHHEPRAIAALAAIVHEDEVAARGS